MQTGILKIIFDLQQQAEGRLKRWAAKELNM
jgi:hypothetical protein